MSTGKPAWRRAFDTVERAIGQPLERAATSPEFVDVAARGMKIRKSVTRAAGRAVGGLTGTVLHAVNMPTRDDVQRLGRNLTVVAAEIRALGIAQQSGRALDAAEPAAEPAIAPAPSPAHSRVRRSPAASATGFEDGHD